MSYDGGCGDPGCEICKDDAEAVRIRHEFYQAMESNRTDTELCSDCPPIGYPTDESRCDACPRCLPLCPDSPDGSHHVAPIGSDEEWMPSKAPCYYCGEKQGLSPENAEVSHDPTLAPALPPAGAVAPQDDSFSGEDQ